MTVRFRDVLLLPLALAVLAAACGQGSATSGGRIPRSDSAAIDISATGPVYIALGDSLSAGFGASDVSGTAFVPLVHGSLGADFQLVNLGHGGDTSSDLIDHGHLSEAVALIEGVNADADPANDVALVTLEIGGNDLLGLYFSSVITGVCPDVTTALAKPECSGPLEDTLDAFDDNLGDALDELLTADPALRLLLMTLYDPFSGFLAAQSEIAQLALEGMPDTHFVDGLNDIIRRHAAARDIPTVELFERFEGRSRELISSDFIHPNDAGYRVMADAVIAALATLP